MDCKATYLSYGQTNQFSTLVLDYLQQKNSLHPFFEYPVSVDGIKAAIGARKKHTTDRQLLAKTFKKTYRDIKLSTSQLENFASLVDENTFTITTAHQPNIFTGYLYFIYKIIHAIKLSDYLKLQLPAYRFVPVFFMGSEDNDFGELSRVNLDGVRLEWNTNQTGAVGRMKIDKGLLQMISSIERQVGNEPFGNEIVEMIRTSYSEGTTIAEATFRFINSLFADFGLLVLIPDDSGLKEKMQPVFEDDLLNHTPHQLVNQSGKLLESDYKVQMNPREINLFYLKDDVRERIIGNSSRFAVNNQQLKFERNEIVEELRKYPERFSPNVVLRGLFQETILPNVVFIGGSSEIAYWLELKELFHYYGVPFPVLVLRNGFLLVKKDQQAKVESLKLQITDLFQSEFELLNSLVKRESSNKLSLEEEKKSLHQLYQRLREQAKNIDQSLLQHIAALETRAIKNLDNLEKKLIRAEKRKFEVEQNQLSKLKAELFPGNDLQERVENFIPYYVKYGKDFLRKIYEFSPALEQRFTVIHDF